MDPIPISRMAEFAGGILFPRKMSILRSKEVSTDSRTLKRGDLFVALRGENFDGHKFIEDAAKGRRWSNCGT